LTKDPSCQWENTSSSAFFPNPFPTHSFQTCSSLTLLNGDIAGIESFVIFQAPTSGLQIGQVLEILIQSRESHMKIAHLVLLKHWVAGDLDRIYSVPKLYERSQFFLVTP
jgi:hypothetical protein